MSDIQKPAPEKTIFRKQEPADMELFFHVYSYFGHVEDDDRYFVERLKRAKRWSQWKAVEGLMEYILAGLSDVTDPEAMAKTLKVAGTMKMTLTPSSRAVNPGDEYIVANREALLTVMELAAEGHCKLCMGFDEDRRGCRFRKALKKLWLRDDWQEEESHYECIGKMMHWEDHG